ncbi:MAG TPA: response regulator [Rhodanobacteraceae bacterium]|nr:response regulator [Rhodanobacteraceae bacterium]
MAHIVIVDDSPTDVQIFTRMLENAGHQVSSAGDADSGIALIKSAQPDVVLMDIIMPGSNGFQATRALAKDPQTAHIPVVIVTTKTMETDRVWGMRQGAKAFLTKPVGERDLLQHIEPFLKATT